MRMKKMRSGKWAPELKREMPEIKLCKFRIMCKFKCQEAESEIIKLKHVGACICV